MLTQGTGILRIHVYELRIGMCVLRLETLDNDSPFLFDRFDIKNQADIQAIQAVCDYVFIDVKRQKENFGSIPTKNSELKKQLKFSGSFEQSARTYQHTHQLIKTVMDDIRFGKPLSVKEVKEAVSECVDKVLEDSNAMLLLTQLKNQDEYTAQHSLNVCILSILLGRELKLSIEELNNIGLCGLLHDIGKMKVPLEILNKPGKLEDDEREIMNKHTVFGRDILMSARDIYAGTVDVAYSHHETLAGTGYPRGLDKTQLSDFTKIVSIADTYDAITSDRIYRKGTSHFIALGILMKAMKTQFETKFVAQFVNCIGFYPQGNLVELNSGEIGIVVEQNKTDRLKPKILLILDKDKKMTNERILDLSLSATDINKPTYTIKNIVCAQDYGIDLIKFYNDGKFTQSYPSAV
ncbi:MAG: HD-GYP domain-containing protein [Methylobacter sp.]